MRLMKTRWLIVALTVMFVVASSGCGTLLHPDRRSAKPSHKLDATIVVLDCLWLLVGVIPGVIALGVDFYNKTIYYSEGEVRAGAGDRITINLRGPALADARVTLRLLDGAGRELAVTEAQTVAGEMLGSPLTVTVPAEANLAGAKLALAIDGKSQVTWSLRPRAN